ncbi:hypothetical protein [Paenibacillus sp. A14]|uniref:hypothetical protein n=1 Tax=Paenibacillus sp. A14 TaxID=3119820 RepID=UPI002FE084FB
MQQTLNRQLNRMMPLITPTSIVIGVICGCNLARLYFSVPVGVCLHDHYLFIPSSGDAAVRHGRGASGVSGDLYTMAGSMLSPHAAAAGAAAAADFALPLFFISAFTYNRMIYQNTVPGRPTDRKGSEISS